MSVNLQKGQKVDLTKGNSSLTKILVGLGWDEAQKPKGGLLGGIFGGSKQQDVDCDASALLCTAGGKVLDIKDVVYFGNLHHKSGCVDHMGDNLTGAGAGDDEQITVELRDIPSSYEKIVFVVNIYQAIERHQHFGMIKNAFIRIVDAATKTELCKYNLSENYDDMTTMIFGEVYRHGAEWKFNAIGQATKDAGLPDVVKRYQ